MSFVINWLDSAGNAKAAIREGSAMRSIHFISGLPRSGSTLLAALLRQNPRFEAAMSGPLAGLFGCPGARDERT